MIHNSLNYKILNVPNYGADSQKQIHKQVLIGILLINPNSNEKYFMWRAHRFFYYGENPEIDIFKHALLLSKEYLKLLQLQNELSDVHNLGSVCVKSSTCANKSFDFTCVFVFNIWEEGSQKINNYLHGSLRPCMNNSNFPKGSVIVSFTSLKPYLNCIDLNSDGYDKDSPDDEFLMLMGKLYIHNIKI